MIKRKNTIIAALILGASLTITGCSAVSYTHLDVYKRQG